MRILALDHGTVRIGVALSDDLKMMASPRDFIPAEPELLSPVAKGLLMLVMATGSVIMLGAFVIVTAIAVF